jgi:hypothetical protein
VQYLLYLLNPVILFATVGLIGGSVLAVFGLRAPERASGVVMILFGLILCLPAVYVYVWGFHRELVDARYSSYKAFYRDIHDGMTREEVFRTLERHYPNTGARKRPKIMEDTAKRLGFFMDPETSFEPNCEGIFLTLNDGRVTEKEYSPD